MDRVIGSLQALDSNCSADLIQMSSATLRKVSGKNISHEDIVKCWLEELEKSSIGKELSFLYVANDVVQKMVMRNLGKEFAIEFGYVLGNAIESSVIRNPSIKPFSYII